MITAHLIPIPGSPVKQQTNEHMTARAPAHGSEDKEDVMSVSALLAQARTHRHSTRAQSKQSTKE